MVVVVGGGGGGGGGEGGALAGSALGFTHIIANFWPHDDISRALT